MGDFGQSLSLTSKGWKKTEAGPLLYKMKVGYKSYFHLCDKYSKMCGLAFFPFLFFALWNSSEYPLTYILTCYSSDIGLILQKNWLEIKELV